MPFETIASLVIIKLFLVIHILFHIIKIKTQLFCNLLWTIVFNGLTLLAEIEQCLKKAPNNLQIMQDSVFSGHQSQHQTAEL